MGRIPNLDSLLEVTVTPLHVPTHNGVQHKVYTMKDTSMLINTTHLQGQVLNAIPRYGTVSPPVVPNWLQSLLKPRAQLYMEVASDCDEHWLRVNLNKSKYEQDPRRTVLEVESSSSVKL